jgi:putative molybdopterin biosynthesis protein
MVEIPQDSEGIEAGETVTARLLRPLCEIKKTVSVIGSHDPMIDQAADLLRIKDPSLSVASSHVGSMGGIMAIKRREAHIAGIHLLDEETGIYNIPYVKKYFPNGGAVLVEGAGRVQGFMTAKGNPKGIKGWNEIVSGKLSYVNRQKGSGTRILCDYLLKKHGVDPKDVRDYDREEYTHTAVAALIAAGSADTGLGIFSAANMYGLDFIPVCIEQYDFLVDADSFEEKRVQSFLEVLGTKEFAERLTELGGYSLDRPGKERKIN